jgi:hypothetical protein
MDGVRIATWRDVAVELLRRRAGGAPLLPDEALTERGYEHLPDLVRKRIDGLYFLTLGVDHPLQRLYQVYWDVQERETRAVLAELQELSVEAAVIKGLELGARYDRCRPVGLRADVDLLLPVAELWKAKKVLYGRGYVNGVYLPAFRAFGHDDPREVGQFEAVHYELMPFRRAYRVELDEEERELARRFTGYFHIHDDESLAIAEFDVHHGLMEGLDISAMRERLVPSALGIGRALAPADHLWFTLHRYYVEVATGSKRNLRPLAWIAPMVADPQVDWDLVVAHALAQESTAPCFYWLSFFEHIAPGAVPAAVLDRLRAGHLESRRDLGWQLGKLFDTIDGPPSLVLEESLARPVDESGT